MIHSVEMLSAEDVKMCTTDPTSASTCVFLHLFNEIIFTFAPLLNTLVVLDNFGVLNQNAKMPTTGARGSGDQFAIGRFLQSLPWSCDPDLGFDPAVLFAPSFATDLEP